MTDLIKLHSILTTATTAESVFGPLTGNVDNMLAQLKTSFRAMAMIAHPDRSSGSAELAEKTFQLLDAWRRRAEDRIRNGIYGTPHAAIPVTTRKGTYLVHEPPVQGDYYTTYRCTRANSVTPQELTLKIVHDPSDNDLLEREAHALRQLARGDSNSRRYFPELVDAFLSTDGTTNRRALILSTNGHTVPLTALRAAYPSGLDARDAAWIFNRILEALWFTHRSGLVHGAVLPTNLSVNLQTHGLLLMEWAFAVPHNAALAAISAPYAKWYPTEVASKGAVTPATDIYMAARCLVFLLGGDAISGQVPDTVPAMLRSFIKGCLLPAPARRPSDAGELREEFDDCLTKLYGKRTFRPLAMPA